MEPAGVGRLPEPGRVARLALRSMNGQRDDRLALLAPAGTTHRFDLRLPPSPILRTAIGLLPAADDEAERLAQPTLRFRVSIRADSEESETVFSGETSSDGAWKDLELDLGPWGERSVTLDLEVSRPQAGGAPQPGGGSEPGWGAWAAPEIGPSAAPEPGWDVLLISLDTLRADRLGSYGHSRPTSPHLDRLAARSVRFAQAVAQSPWTRPSHRALFSGRFPSSHGRLDSPPLAVALWRAGYRTLALTGGGQLDGRFGFSRGFDRFVLQDWIRSPETLEDCLGVADRRRLFLFLHTYEIHDPYDHDRFAAPLPAGRFAPGFSKRDWQGLGEQGPSAEERAYVEALYDGGIAYTDEQLGVLVDLLERNGRLESTIVVVTSDHGEQFWEHGSWGHGQNVYDHQLLVPLILYLPPGLRRELAGGDGSSLAGRVIEQQVSLVDLYPTLLDLLDVPLAPSRIQGRSLRPLLEGGSLEPRFAFAENTNVARFERKALRGERYKLHYSIPKSGRGEDPSESASERFELYDLEQDPAERIDLAGDLPEERGRLERLLRDLLAGASGGAAPLDEPAPEGIDPELRRRLEALGYVE